MRYEQYSERDRTFSRWHRTLGDECAAIDIDFCEYCDKCRAPIALIETAQDVGQAHKCATVTKNLAQRADISAWVILYEIAEQHEQIGSCRVARLYPYPTELRQLSADYVGNLIESLHSRHGCGESDIISLKPQAQAE